MLGNGKFHDNTGRREDGVGSVIPEEWYDAVVMAFVIIVILVVCGFVAYGAIQLFS